MGHTCNPSTQEVEVGALKAQGHPQLSIKSETSLGYRRVCLERKERRKKVGRGREGEGMRESIHCDGICKTCTPWSQPKSQQEWGKDSRSPTPSGEAIGNWWLLGEEAKPSTCMLSVPKWRESISFGCHTPTNMSSQKIWQTKLLKETHFMSWYLCARHSFHMEIYSSHLFH